MHSAILTKTQRDNKHYYTLWNDWVLYHANSTGVQELQHCLCAFVLKVRKIDGNPNTLHQVKLPLEEDYWYTKQPLGHCTLDTTV